MHMPTPLPKDVDMLKQLVADRDGLIAKLLAEIARLRRWQFGRSSERLDAALAQLQLALGDLPAAAPAAAPVAKPPQESLPAEESTQQPQPRNRVLPFRRAPRSFPAHLPRETVYVEPLGGDVVSAQVYRRRKGNHAGKPSGRYRTAVLERAYRCGWEIYESLCRGTVDSAGNPLTFG